ncbi:MAG: YkvA family protein [Melioribacteraceae bacterium]|nr:YkvA family protein [Melioribacteraceae bacterium]
MNSKLDEFEEQFSTEANVEKGSQYVEENLWTKVEKVGNKIRFAKDVKALYRYMRDKYVPWYRKSIVIGALIYFITPIDAVPDLAPLIGYLDDLGVIAAVIKFLGSEILPYYD